MMSSIGADFRHIADDLSLEAMSLPDAVPSGHQATTSEHPTVCCAAVPSVATSLIAAAKVGLLVRGRTRNFGFRQLLTDRETLSIVYQGKWSK